MSAAMTGEEVADALERLAAEASPLPWAACEAPWGDGTAIYTGAGDPHGQRLVADCDTSFLQGPDDEDHGDDTANARLIAALARNLPLILAHLRAGSDAAVERAAKALAGPWIGDDGPWTFDLDQAQNLARAAIRAAVEP